MDIMEDYMQYVGYGYCMIDDNTGGDQQDEEMEIFNVPRSDKFRFCYNKGCQAPY